jgi:ketosteroid isomerase-like protein
MQIIDTYYDILAAFDAERLRAILAPELAFEGPLAGRRTGAEGFIKGAGDFAAVARNLTMLDRVEDGVRAAALYDADLPGGTVRFAEFFTVADGRIASLRLHYDATKFQAAVR